MNVTIQIPDAVYAQLLNGNRMKGTIEAESAMASSFINLMEDIQ